MSVKMLLLRTYLLKSAPPSVNQPVLRMDCPDVGLLSVNPIILRMGLNSKYILDFRPDVDFVAAAEAGLLDGAAGLLVAAVAA